MCGGSVRAMLALYRSRSKGFAMFRKIIWATDGSEAADRALPYVKEVAASSGSAVVVCHSVLALLGPRAGGVPVLAGEDDIESKIRGQVDALTGSGIEASLRIVGGDTVHGAAHEIVRVADEEDADLIVAGRAGPPRSVPCCSAASRSDCCTWRAARSWSSQFEHRKRLRRPLRPPSEPLPE